MDQTLFEGDSAIGKHLYVRNREDWRSWLRRNYATEKEVWLVYYKHTDEPSIPYDDSVEEALCFGWIDSIIKKVDEAKFVRKFTPRKDKSRWSEANKRRANKMIKKGQMMEPGLSRIEDARRTGEWFQIRKAPRAVSLPAPFVSALSKSVRASKNFHKLAPTYKRQYVAWISSAKREETRAKRVAEAIKLLEKGEKLGMK
jgi:uncharacterized protein YdeI (YjbR/CyaY-like superfamily)